MKQNVKHWLVTFIIIVLAMMPTVCFGSISSLTKDWTVKLNDKLFGLQEVTDRNMEDNRVVWVRTSLIFAGKKVVVVPFRTMPILAFFIAVMAVVLGMVGVEKRRRMLSRAA